MKYFIVGVTVLLIFSMTGCGGVSHKSPEKVTEELINAYANGKEKKVKDCYNEKKDTEDSLQSEITATIKYFQAHNTKKVNIQECDIISENDKYPTTFSEINEQLLEYEGLGGYLRIRHDRSTRYIDYISEWTEANAQILDFGKNLTDYTQTDDSDDIATYVIPLGCRMSETEYSYNDGYFKTSDTTVNKDKEYFTKSDNGYSSCGDLKAFESGKTYYEYSEELDESNLSLTLEGLSNLKYDEAGYIKNGDCIYCEEAVKKYGWIGVTYENTDIKDRETLLSRGTVVLKELISPKRTIEIKAIDMHLVNPEIKPIRIGEYVRVRSKPHNLDSYFLCTSISLDLDNPENSSYTLGTTFDTLTGQQNKRIKLLNASINSTYEEAAKLTEQEKRNAMKAADALKNANAAQEAASSAVKSILETYAVSNSPTDVPEDTTDSGEEMPLTGLKEGVKQLFKDLQNACDGNIRLVSARRWAVDESGKKVEGNAFVMKNGLYKCKNA